MMDERKFLEAIDACRPGRNDLVDATLGADPRMAEARELLLDSAAAREQRARVERLDQQIGAAIAQVEVPAGLEARLIAALSTSRVAGEPAAALRVYAPTDSATTVDAETNEAKARPIRRSRRALLVGGVAAAAAVLAIAITMLGGRAVYDRDTIDLKVREFWARQANDPGVRMAEKAAPAEFNASGQVRGIEAPDTIWRRVRGLLGRSGIAYDFQSPTGAAATLFVVKVKGPPGSPDLTAGLANAPPTRPSFTNNLVTASWREAERAMILVVRGNEQDYRAMIRPANIVASLPHATGAAL